MRRLVLPAMQACRITATLTCRAPYAAFGCWLMVIHRRIVSPLGVLLVERLPYVFVACVVSALVPVFPVLQRRVGTVVHRAGALWGTRLLRQVWHLTLPLCGWNAAGHYARRIMHDAGLRRGLEARSGIAHLAQHDAAHIGAFSSPRRGRIAGRLASSEHYAGSIIILAVCANRAPRTRQRSQNAANNVKERAPRRSHTAALPLRYHITCYMSIEWRTLSGVRDHFSRLRMRYTHLECAWRFWLCSTHNGSRLVTCDTPNLTGFAMFRAKMAVVLNVICSGNIWGVLKTKDFLHT